MSMWAVIEIEHGTLLRDELPCEGCLELAPDAIAYARAIGSRKSTKRLEQVGKPNHSATVQRTYAVLGE